MRTTLTIDDDLAAILQKMAAEEGHSFKEVVNQMLRSGIAATGEQTARRQPVAVVTRPLGLREGYDPDRLNQLVDELAVEDFLRKGAKDGSSRR
jgi:Arc/MetJ family transcription regulator